MGRKSAGRGALGAKKRHDRRGKLRGAIRLASVGLAAAAVAKELRRPKKDRTWQGNLGKIPYDFRTPSPKRIKRSLWAPDNPRVFVPRAFGVGWSINFASVKAQLKKFLETSSEMRPRG